MKIFFTICISLSILIGDSMASNEAPKKVLTISSVNLQVIRAAIKEAERKSFPLTKGAVEIFESPDVYIVVFGNTSTVNPHVRGNLSDIPNLQIQINKSNYELVGSSYLR